ncbi:hypothetical protein F5Y15DRAFT_403125 [Xylariaceae sp. FL0016]|nr:hypothetical protein F5Y15DRAFT_403125 [Xylariaceae sp. FL0016]
MDRSLDEIVAESQQKKRGNRSRRVPGGRGGDSGRLSRDTYTRDSYPRDGVRKSTRDDSRGVDSDWVHDRFDDHNARDRPRNQRRRRSAEPAVDRQASGTKIRIENLHYDLSEEDLEGLFSKIGRVLKLELVYDRAGRSEGVAYVTYDRRNDAEEAIQEFNGANAKGQPIRLSIVASAPRRNPFDSAVMPGRSLADRITRPRSLSPNDRGIDRYVPDGSRRSRSPMRRPRGGRRPGARRERGGRAGERDERTRGRDGRPKKTQDELDAEMADYFGGSTETAPQEATSGHQDQGGDGDGDIDIMIE